MYVLNGVLSKYTLVLSVKQIRSRQNGDSNRAKCHRVFIGNIY